MNGHGLLHTVAAVVVPGVVAVVVLLAAAGLLAALSRHRKAAAGARCVPHRRSGRAGSASRRSLPIGPPDPWTELGDVPVPLQRRRSTADRADPAGRS